MNKTVGPPTITPTGLSGGMNLTTGSSTSNIYSSYYKAIDQFQNKNTTDKDLHETLKQGPISSNLFYNNFLNELNNKNNNFNNNINNNNISNSNNNNNINNNNNNSNITYNNNMSNNYNNYNNRFKK
ncbi:hypothetical protein ACTFIY_004335 [Dictyostelium cf. discoideum]